LKGIQNKKHDVTNKDNSWYIINGVKFDQQPTQKGVHIHVEDVKTIQRQ